MTPDYLADPAVHARCRRCTRGRRCEHACKLVSTVSGLRSALAGNVAREWQPRAPLLPFAAGAIAVDWFAWRLCRQDVPASKRRLEVASAP